MPEYEKVYFLVNLLFLFVIYRYMAVSCKPSANYPQQSTNYDKQSELLNSEPLERDPGLTEKLI